MTQQAKNGLIGLDIGGTKTEALLVDATFTQRSQLREPTITDDPQQFLASLSHTIETVVAQANMQLTDIAAIGLGIPGQVNRETGQVKSAVNLNLGDTPIGQHLARKFGIPVLASNDTHNAALGSYHLLNKPSSLAYIGIGTGVAAGLILNGQLYQGANQMAGEIGHVIFENNGPLCKCGQQGCLEAVASGPAIVKQAQQMISNQPIDSPQDLYALASQGHFPAQIVVKRVSKSIARAIQLLLMAYDVEKVVIGGGVAQLGDAFLEPILAELRQLQQQSPLAQTVLQSTKVTLAPASLNPGVWGAVHLAQQAIA